MTAVIDVQASYVVHRDTAANRPASVNPPEDKLYIFEATDTGVISLWSISTSSWESIGQEVTVSAYGSADQTGLADNVYTTVAFNTEQWDVGGYFNTTTYDWTPPPGIYRIGIQVRMSTVGDVISFGQIRLRKNGSTTVVIFGTFAPSSNVTAFALGTILIEANGTDSFSVEARSNTVSGSTWDINAGSDVTWFQAERI